MKKTFFLLLLLGLCYKGLYAQNINAGFESGNFSNWSANKGTRTQSQGICGDNSSPGWGPLHTLVTPGPDPVIGAVIPRVVEGNYALKLGGIGGLSVQRAWYHYTVQNTNPFKFYFAVVMDDPGHNGCFQPFFQYKIRLGSISGPVLTDVRIDANQNNPYFTRDRSYIYKNWDCYSLPVQPSWVGQNLVVEFISGNCTLGAPTHFCYAYIDGLGRNIPLVPQFTLPKTTYCRGEDIIADASATWLEKDHFWSIVESDANGNVINPQNEKSQWFVAQQAGVKNISQLYAQLGGSFQCGKYYRIKLAVVNSCVGWTEIVKLVNINCPSIYAGPDICYPNCAGGGSVYIGGPVSWQGRMDIKWLPGPGGNTSYLQNPTTPFTTLSVPPGAAFPQTYYLSATTSGCTAYDTVKVYCGCPNVNLITISYIGPGQYKLTIPASELGKMASFEVQVYQNNQWNTYLHVTSPGTTQYLINSPSDPMIIFRSPCCEVIRGFGLPRTAGTGSTLVENDAKSTITATEQPAEEALSIYPNPVSAMLTIERPADLQPGKSVVVELYSLYSFDGNPLFSSEYRTALINLDMSSYPRGIYLLRISSEAGVSSHRIVKE